jgi:hypothetical protein
MSDSGLHVKAPHKPSKEKRYSRASTRALMAELLSDLSKRLRSVSMLLCVICPSRGPVEHTHAVMLCDRCAYFASETVETAWKR